ncbi:MAG: MATE family efflux transporter [Pseudobutyrivibrio sp.]|nr:MATE family efflux transporter [Pseudobutyrivibrio sp.]
MGYKDKRHIFNTLISLALPTMLEQILSVLMQYVDTAMVGHLGPNATAAVSVSTTITWLIGSIPGAFGVATMSLIAQAIGRKDEEDVKKIARHSLIIAVFIGAIIGFICYLIADYVPYWMGADETVCHDAALYFRVISCVVLFRAVNIILNNALRAAKDTRTPMYIGIGSNVLNVVLDYIFIYQMGGGVFGAAMATAVSTAFAGSVSLFAFLSKNEFKNSIEHVSMDRGILLKMWKMSYPVLIINVASCSGYVVFAGMVSHMGTWVFAAHSIALGAEELFYIGGYGFKSAATTLTGISYGEQDYDKYKSVTKMATAMTIGVMLISGVLLYNFALPLMELFTTDATVAQMGATVLKMVAFSEPFFGIYVVTEGFYYGLGNTRYPLFVELFGMWIVRILSTYYCVNYIGGDLSIVWMCMIADNVAKAILLAIRVPKLRFCFMSPKGL